MWGGITLVIVMFGGLGITSQLQRKGLHRKDKRKGIYIVSRTNNTSSTDIYELAFKSFENKGLL